MSEPTDVVAPRCKEMPDPCSVCGRVNNGWHQGFGFAPLVSDPMPAFRICMRCFYKAMMWAAGHSTVRLQDERWEQQAPALEGE